MAKELSPRNNHKIFGHQEAYNELISSFNSGRTPHAWLISGKKGIGKSTLVYNFVKYIFNSGPSNHADIKISSGCHSDLLVIEKKADSKEISIDEIRKINHFLSLTPSESIYRIVIIDSCDELNINSANALLKILEEPPKNTFIFLICNAIGSLPVTIISRCRVLTVKNLSDKDALAAYLYLSNDNDFESAKNIVSLSGNSPALALDLKSINGIKIYEKIIALINDIDKLDIKTIYKLDDELQKIKNSWQIFTLLINKLIFKSIRKFSNVDNIVYISHEEQQVINNITNHCSIEDLFELSDKLGLHLKEAESSHLDYKQVMFVMFEEIRNKLINRI
jgi:DNA polymerase-3 subunit delta'